MLTHSLNTRVTSCYFYTSWLSTSRTYRRYIAGSSPNVTRARPQSLLFCARIQLLFPRIRHVSVPSGRTKAETNFAGRQTGYHRHDSDVGAHYASANARTDVRMWDRSGRLRTTVRRNEIWQIFSRVSRVGVQGRAEWRYGKPRVPLLVCETLTS